MLKVENKLLKKLLKRKDSIKLTEVDVNKSYIVAVDLSNFEESLSARKYLEYLRDNLIRLGFKSDNLLFVSSAKLEFIEIKGNEINLGE